MGMLLGFSMSLLTIRMLGWNRIIRCEWGGIRVQKKAGGLALPYSVKTH